MKGKHYTTQQKIRILREGEQSGTAIRDVCRAHQINEQTYHRWKRQFRYAGGRPVQGAEA